MLSELNPRRIGQAVVLGLALVTAGCGEQVSDKNDSASDGQLNSCVSLNQNGDINHFMSQRITTDGRINCTPDLKDLQDPHIGAERGFFYADIAHASLLMCVNYNSSLGEINPDNVFPGTAVFLFSDSDKEYPSPMFLSSENIKSLEKAGKGTFGSNVKKPYRCESHPLPPANKAFVIGFPPNYTGDSPASFWKIEFSLGNY